MTGTTYDAGMTSRSAVNLAALVGALLVVGAAAAGSGFWMWTLLCLGLCVWAALLVAVVADRRRETPAQPAVSTVRIGRRAAALGVLILGGIASTMLGIGVAMSPIELANAIPCGSYFAADPGATRAVSIAQANQRYESMRGGVPASVLAAEDYRDEALNLAGCSDARQARAAPAWGLIAAGIVLLVGGTAAFMYLRSR